MVNEFVLVTFNITQKPTVAKFRNFLMEETADFIMVNKCTVLVSLAVLSNCDFIWK